MASILLLLFHTTIALPEPSIAIWGSFELSEALDNGCGVPTNPKKTSATI